MTSAPLGWLGIVRLGLVQTALGSIVVLTTSTLNRVMVVELAMPAMLPGALVGIHYAIQVLRPRWGYGSDVGGRRTPWIVGGMAVLAGGGFFAALATALMETNPVGGVILSVVAFLAIGVGVGASGTSLLVLLAIRVDASRRAAAATTVWVMMLIGFILTASLAGHFLDPFSTLRLVVVMSVVAGSALVVTTVAVWGIEGHRERAGFSTGTDTAATGTRFRQALAEVWSEPDVRRFAVFVFVSMLAYSAQDLILEPFAGAVFYLTPGESTKLAGLQHGGVLVGMVLVALVGTGIRGYRIGSMHAWAVFGCLLSGLSLIMLAVGAYAAPSWPLRPTVFTLGLGNGAFAVAAIGAMMALVGKGRKAREGTRMGLWGAAQAVAFGLGGFVGTAGVDIVRAITPSVAHAYALVFSGAAVTFFVSAALVVGIKTQMRRPTPPRPGHPTTYAVETGGL